MIGDLGGRNYTKHGSRFFVGLGDDSASFLGEEVLVLKNFIKFFKGNESENVGVSVLAGRGGRCVKLRILVVMLDC